MSEYLQLNQNETVVHGDLNCGNIITENKTCSAKSLIDFAFTGRGNPYADFRDIPVKYSSDFFKGYETESGKKIDPDLIAATRIAMDTGYIRCPVAMMNRLNEAQSITGMTFDVS